MSDDIARLMGISDEELAVFKERAAKLTPTETMAILRRQGVREELIQRSLGADYQPPAASNH